MHAEAEAPEARLGAPGARRAPECTGTTVRSPTGLPHEHQLLRGGQDDRPHS